VRDAHCDRKRGKGKLTKYQIRFLSQGLESLKYTEEMENKVLEAYLCDVGRTAGPLLLDRHNFGLRRGIGTGDDGFLNARRDIN
jgi:hypothetical protein